MRTSIPIALLVLIVSNPLCGNVIIRPIELPGSALDAKVALVSFYNGGHVDPTGKGIAVVDAKGEPVGYRVLASDPSGRTWLAVDLAGGADGLKLQYSRQPIRSAKVDHELVPSLFMQVYPLRGKPSENVDTLERVIATTRPLGSMQVSNISSAHNPFGPGEWFITLFQGQITVGKKRTLSLFSAHDDAAFVQIDGKTIIKGAAPQLNRSSEYLAGKAVPVDLSKGTHTVRYVHAQRKDRSLALLGFISGKRALPLPQHLFVHHPLAKLGEASYSDDKPAVGFDAHQLDQLGYGDTVYSRWQLKAISAAPEGTQYRWTFGDGTKLLQPAAATTDPGKRAIEHVFVGDISDLGNWMVKLELIETPQKVLGSAKSRLRAISVANVSSTGNVSLVRAYAAAIQGCDYQAASSKLTSHLYTLLATAEEAELLLPLVNAFVDLPDRTIDKAGWDMQYTLAALVAQDQPERAAKLYLRLARSTSVDSWKSTCAAAQYVDLSIFRLNKADQVQSIVYSLFAKRTVRERSLLLARLGDVHRLAGNVEAAAKAYQDAQRNTYRQMDERKASVLDRAYREAAVSLLAQERYPAMRDTLFQWEADFPTAKLGSDLPLLTGRYFQAVGDEARAAIEFETLLKLNPDHPSRPEIVFRLAQSLARLGKKQRAGTLFDEVAEKYPNSPFAAGAAAWQR